MAEALPAPVQQHPFWHLCGIGLLLLLWGVNRRAQTSGIFLLALWNLMGVMLHELAHLLVGILLRARPTRLSLMPRRVGNYWHLGSVSFSHITAFNAVPIAFAPLILAGIAYVAVLNWFFWFNPAFSTTLALYGTLFVLVYNALPSRQDLRVACNWRSLLFYLPLLALIIFILYQ
jgi:hypothetical protein